MLRTNNIAWRKLLSLFLKLLRGETREKHKIVQIAVFPIIFVTACLKNLQNLKCGILELLSLSQIESVHFTHYVTII